jgi:PKD repeat protein
MERRALDPARILLPNEPMRTGQRSTGPVRWRAGTLVLLGAVTLLMMLAPPAIGSAPSHASAPIPLSWDARGPGALSPTSGLSPPLPLGAAPVGAVAAATPIQFTFEYSVMPSAVESAFMAGLYQPGSPYYHQYMRGNSFFEAFGPTADQVAAFQDYLAQHGLTVSYVGGPWIYEVNGPASGVDSAFGTTLTEFRSGGQTEMAPSGELQLPADLAGLVNAVDGLNHFVLPHPTYSRPQITGALATPKILQTFYNAAPLISGGDTGTSYAIGLAEECDPSQADSTYQTDVNSYDSAYSLPSVTLNLIGSGAPTCNGGQSGWGIETDLDIQSSHSLATGAPLYVCLDGTGNPDVCDQTFITDQSTDNIDFGSNSFGGGGADHSVWQAADAAGMTLLASAGDSCSAVNYPAAEPDGLGVGGTTLTWGTGGTFKTETDWSCSGGEGTGGGCDTSDSPPSYQVGMTGYPGVCASGDRGVPDVGMDANPSSGIDVYNGNSANGCDPCQVGGTSLASPLWTASLDLIYTYASASGFAGPTIYSIAKGSNYATAFHDITSGSNGNPCTAGWDPDTGVGSPNLDNLAMDWNGGGSTGNPTVSTPSAAPSSADVGQSVSFTSTLTGPGAGSDTYAWTSSPATGLGCAASTSLTLTCVPTSSNVYAVTITVTDSAGHTGTATLSGYKVYPDPTVAVPVGAPNPDQIGTAITFTSHLGLAGSGGDAYAWTEAPAAGLGCAASTSTTLGCTPTSAGSYTVTITVTDSNGGTGANTSASETVTTIHPSVTAPVSTPHASADVGQHVTFTSTLSSPGAGGDTYSWAFSPASGLGCASANALFLTCAPSAVGTYTVTITVTDSAGNSGTASLTGFAVYADPTITGPVGAPAAIDVTQSVTFTATVTNPGSGGGTFAWNAPAALGCATSHAATVACTSTGAGAFLVTASMQDSDGEFANGTVTYIVNALPTVTAPTPSPSTVVVGEHVTFTTTSPSPGTSPDTYAWSVAPASGLTCAASTSTSVTCLASATGSYVVSVKVTDAVGLTDSASSVPLSVSTPAPLTAQASANVSSGALPLAVAFTGVGSGGVPAYAYAWEFGDGQAGAGPGVNHTFESPGTYTVWLWVNDSAGHSATSTVTVTVTGPSGSSGNSLSGTTWLSNDWWVLLLIAAVAAAAIIGVALARRRKPGDGAYAGDAAMAGGAMYGGAWAGSPEGAPYAPAEYAGPPPGAMGAGSSWDTGYPPASAAPSPATEPAPVAPLSTAPLSTAPLSTPAPAAAAAAPLPDSDRASDETAPDPNNWVPRSSKRPPPVPPSSTQRRGR